MIIFRSNIQKLENGMFDAFCHKRWRCFCVCMMNRLFFRPSQSHRKLMKVQGLSLVWVWRLNTYSGNHRDTWDEDWRWTLMVQKTKSCSFCNSPQKMTGSVLFLSKNCPCVLWLFLSKTDQRKSKPWADNEHWADNVCNHSVNVTYLCC